MWSQASLGKKGLGAEVVLCLPSKCEALSSNPVLPGKKKKKDSEVFSVMTT
jgi:hypothetical protein